MTFPLLPEGWAETRRLLAGYAGVLGAVRELLDEPGGDDSHRGLVPGVAGPGTGALTLGDVSIEVDIDFTQHQIVATTSATPQSVRMPLLGQPPRIVCRDLCARFAAADLDLPLDCEGLDPEPGRYRGGDVLAWWQACLRIGAVLRRLRASGEFPAGPLALWPRDLGLGFSWYPTVGEAGRVMSLGFVAGDDAARFHVSVIPAPADPGPGPMGSVWRGNGFELPYTALAAEEQAADRLLEFFREAAWQLCDGTKG